MPGVNINPLKLYSNTSVPREMETCFLVNECQILPPVSVSYKEVCFSCGFIIVSCIHSFNSLWEPKVINSFGIAR